MTVPNGDANTTRFGDSAILNFTPKHTHTRTYKTLQTTIVPVVLRFRNDIFYSSRAIYTRTQNTMDTFVF